MSRLALIIVMLTFLSNAAWGDIFKPNDQNSSAFQQAVANDGRGFYYRQGLDDNLTSSFSSPFNFAAETVKKRVSRQINFDKTIAHQLHDLSFANIDAAMTDVNRSALLLLQYSSPAAADLFKYYNTLAYLKYGIFYSDLERLENGKQVDLDYWRDQSEIECLKQKVGRGEFAGDIIDAMASCRDPNSTNNGAFAYLNYSAGGSTMNVFEKVFNRLNLRGDQRDEMLEILPKWQINADGFQLRGPDKRIGQVFAEDRQRLMDELNGALNDYPQQKQLGEDVVKDFYEPGVPFTEKTIRNLLVLPPEQMQMAVAHLASGAAWVQTMDRYDSSIEWLRRSLEHPSLEEAYKNVMRHGIEFLNQEKISLQEKHEQLKRFAAGMVSVLDAADQERLELIAQGQEARSRKDQQQDVFNQ